MRIRSVLTRSGVTAVVALVPLAACGDPDEDAQPSQPAAAHEGEEPAAPAVVTGSTNDEGQDCRGGVDRSFELATSLNGAADASDVVISGTVAAAESDVRFPSSEHDGYTVYDIDVEEVLGGDIGGQDQVKAVIATHSSGCLLPEDQSGPFPEVGDRGVWMLNQAEEQGDYAQLYMLSHVQAVINEPVDDAARSNHELEVFSTGSDPITDEVDELGTLDNVLQRLRNG